MTTVKGPRYREAVPQSPQPRALIISIYGLYAREAGGWLSVATTVRLLAALGVDEPAVRSSISRLKRRGMLVAEPRDGAAGYGLSAAALAILREGDRRIFARRTAALDDGWVLVIFSVPEAERSRRHTLRSRLSWLGFGTVAPGVWIAPAHVADEAADLLGRLGLSHYVDLFTARPFDAADLRKHVSSWWDLDRIQRSYADYIDRWLPVLEARRQGGAPPRQAFADYVRTLTAWRRLPYLDPGLPEELLPDGWRGREAADVFFGLRDLLAGPAHAFVDQVRHGGTTATP